MEDAKNRRYLWSQAEEINANFSLKIKTTLYLAFAYTK